MTRTQEIEAAFATPETLDDLSRRLGCGRSTVQRAWKAAQDAGRLPKERPQFAAAAGRLKGDDFDIDFEKMTDVEFEEYQRREDEIEEIRRGANVASCDALLAALKRAHGTPSSLVPDMPDIDRLVAARQRTERERSAKAAGLGHVSEYEVRS